MLRILRGIFYFDENYFMATIKKAIPQKKNTVKTATKKEKPLIKYSDKSAGQPELVVIFERLKQLMLPFEKGAIKVHADTGGQIHLISHKAIEIEGRKRPEVWFVSTLVQKGYVGFYFMPLSVYKPQGEKQHPELMKCLKGKACFHIKKNDETLYKQIKEALKMGYDIYKEKGWV